MANPIPPLVCSTPPPIEDMDRFSYSEDCIDSCDYDENTDIEISSEGPSLPSTPQYKLKIKNNISTADIPDNFNNIEEGCGNKDEVEQENTKSLKNVYSTYTFSSSNKGEETIKTITILETENATHSYSLSQDDHNIYLPNILSFKTENDTQINFTCDKNVSSTIENIPDAKEIHLTSLKKIENVEEDSNEMKKSTSLGSSPNDSNCNLIKDEKEIIILKNTCNQEKNKLENSSEFQNDKILNLSKYNFITQTQVKEGSNTNLNIVENTDICEFDEFSDFKAAPVNPITQTITVQLTEKSNFENFMQNFNLIMPIETFNENELRNPMQRFLENDSIICKLNQIDLANALEFQWNKSSLKHSLIKSLGIDARNVLYGEKWHCSIPKFAANLGFIPLEPLKPIKTSETTYNNTNHLIASDNMTLKKSNDMPDISFEWKNSVVTNSSEGKEQKNITNTNRNDNKNIKFNFEFPTQSHEFSISNSKILEEKEKINSKNEDKTEEIPTKIKEKISDIEFLSENLSYEKTSIDETHVQIEKGVNKDYFKGLETEGFDKQTENKFSSLNIQNLFNINENKNLQIEKHNKNKNDILNLGTSGSHIVPFKETHIYTPTKSENAISHSIECGTISVNDKTNAVHINSSATEDTDTEKSISIDKDYKSYTTAGTIINEKVIKKEYHDVEYNLSTQIGSDVVSNKNTMPLNYEINNPTISVSEKSKIDSEIKYLEAKENALVVETDIELKNASNNKEFFSQPTLDMKSDLCKNPIDFEISTKDLNERENSSLSDISHSLKNDAAENGNVAHSLQFDGRMILSPAILLPKGAAVNSTNIPDNENLRIEWPNPGISRDDLFGLEYIANSASAINNKELGNKEVKNEEDDWSDFVSVPHIPLSPCRQQNILKTKTSNLNIIYNPQSPTHVSRHIDPQKTSCVNINNDDDEWSDFVSNVPISETINGNQNKKINDAIDSNCSLDWLGSNNSQSNNQNLHISKNINPNIENKRKEVFMNEKNENNISQYLLNFSEERTSESHSNRNNNMLLNSLKPTDFIAHHHMQHQNHQAQQNMLFQSTSNTNQFSSNNVSFIPDLSFSLPTKRIINRDKVVLKKK